MIGLSSLTDSVLECGCFTFSYAYKLSFNYNFTDFADLLDKIDLGALCRRELFTELYNAKTHAHVNIHYVIYSIFNKTKIIFENEQPNVLEE